jgi:hypothetical protein
VLKAIRACGAADVVELVLVTVEVTVLPGRVVVEVEVTVPPGRVVVEVEVSVVFWPLSKGMVTADAMAAPTIMPPPTFKKVRREVSFPLASSDIVLKRYVIRIYTILQRRVVYNQHLYNQSVILRDGGSYY